MTIQRSHRIALASRVYAVEARCSSMESPKEPLHIISLGAGVQSSTMALMAAAGEITPMPMCAIFADTQDEPASVYKYLDWLEPMLPFQTHRVTAGSLSKSILDLRKSKRGSMFSKTSFPAFTLSSTGEKAKIVNRACTRDFKLVPIQRKTKELVGEASIKVWRKKHRISLAVWNAYLKAEAEANAARKANKPIPPRLPFPSAEWKAMQADALVIQWIGISLDEIIRMKPSRKPWVENRWPLIEARMNRHNCQRWIEAHGFPMPPRSACRYCPYHSDDEWRRQRDEEPSEFEKSLQFEKSLNLSRTSQLFLHRSCKPLDQVDFSTDVERGQATLTGFGNECEGMCGV